MYQWIEADDEVGICAIQVAEFYRGVPPADRLKWDGFFQTLTYWDISLEAARQAGVLRWDYDQRGIVLALTDTLIAALGRQMSAVLVTNNVKDYPMEGIHLLSLRQ